MQEDGDIGDEDDAAYDHSIDSELPIHVLPLYSLLSSDKQAKVCLSCTSFVFRNRFRLGEINENYGLSEVSIISFLRH